MNNRKFLTHMCAIFLIANFTACKNYSVSLNNNIVYTPASLFTKFTIADEHLHNCVEQTIEDKHITKPEDLKQLICTDAGIKSLAGLEIFTAIEQLDLHENNLTSVAQLSKLSRITLLNLHKNNLTSAEPLLSLLHLRTLDISDNKHLNCRDLYQLVANFRKGELNVTLPEQCNKNS